MEIPEGCKGCIKFIPLFHCAMIQEKQDAECPCSICIIKTMCSQLCVEFQTFYFVKQKEIKGTRNESTM